VFAERGLDVALDEIARRAGVSIGTLYNRFPTRAELVRAVFADRAETVVRITEHALGMADPWAGFVHFVEQVCRMLAADRGYNDLAARALPQATPQHARGHELMTRVVERAREAGALRADFTLSDMAFVIWAITRTVEATAGVEPDAWRRHLGFILDGLRAPAAHPLPVPPLTEDQVARVMRDC
jgi:AcrR family transcriptional regulator